MLPSLFIRQGLFAYAASVKVLHPAVQLDTSASVMSYLAIFPLISFFIAFCGKRLPV